MGLTTEELQRIFDAAEAPQTDCLGIALLVAWGALIIALLMAKPSQAVLREALRLLYRW